LKNLLQSASGNASRDARPAIRRGRASQRGVTLLELLIVATLIALLTGIAYPSAAAGIESLRFRSVTDQISGLLNTAMDHAQRRQQVVEVWISPKDNLLIARSPDLGFVRRLEIPASFHITSVLPATGTESGEARRFLMFPGGRIPAIGVELANATGVKRMVRVDPLSGLPLTTEVKN
jgi:prepilin-type N-terminal cleavage/methylation domain-containing protein